MWKVFKKSLGILLIFTLIVGVIYPTFITVCAQTFFKDKANGSLIVKDGEVVASKLIGQNFTSPEYFWGRPSATVDYPYNGVGGSGSNKTPAGDELEEIIKKRIEELQKYNGTDEEIPVDLVTASGSGLDPDISLAAAEYQVKRVAEARNMSEEEVQSIVDELKQKRILGFFGETYVNVVELNLRLDEIQE